jgi:hypothetical protein
MAADDEWKILQDPTGRVIIAIALGILAIAARWRTTKSAKSADTMQFEEVDEVEILTLGLT